MQRQYVSSSNVRSVGSNIHSLAKMHTYTRIS